MPQAGENSKKLLEKFPFIDIIIGTHNIHHLKEYLTKRISTGKAFRKFGAGN
jgi:tRNA A37 methylthiotransferase MiaB